MYLHLILSKNIFILLFWQVFRLDERKIQNGILPRQNGKFPRQNGNFPRQNGNLYGKIPIFWIDWQRKPYACEKLIFKRKKNHRFYPCFVIKLFTILHQHTSRYLLLFHCCASMKLFVHWRFLSQWLSLWYVI